MTILLLMACYTNVNVNRFEHATVVRLIFVNSMTYKVRWYRWFHNQHDLEEIDKMILLLISYTTNVNMMRFGHDTVGAAGFNTACRE